MAHPLPARRHCPIAIAVLAIFLLPESLKFLVLNNRKRENAIRTVRALDPSLPVGADTRFIVHGEKAYSRFTPKLLFAGRLA